ncbi:MAG TPA: HAD family hydrolase [Paludibacter sp.]|nr:HAD family hydrolase [Paludibacter sp.]
MQHGKHLKKLVIFDLDGTLLDTVADLAASTNHALRMCGFPPHEVDSYRFFIGNGLNKLLERALPETAKTSENITQLRVHFLEYYREHNSDLTVPYKGIPELLLQLQETGVKLAVASNKYHEGTQQLVNQFFPDIRFSAVFGQRENIPAKPDPVVVEDILAIAGTNKNEVLYVGDSGVDMQTAKNAGIDAAGVTWGLRPRAELEAFSPEFLIDKPGEVLDIINEGKK